MPRFIPPGTLVEITMRTNASRMHLRPSPELNMLILGILGRALTLYPVMMHAFTFLSNHWHAMVTTCDAEALASFLRYVNGNVAKAAQRVNGVKGKVWQQRTSVISILDEGAQLERLKYVLAHGTKEGLVSSPLLWPGATSTRALAGVEPLVGTWINGTRKSRLERSARRRKTPVNPIEYTETYAITLAPLPVFDGMDIEDRQREVRRMLREIEAAHPGPHLGVAGVLAQDPLAEPRETNHSPAPRVHTTSVVLALRYARIVGDFCRAYWAAGRRHRQRPTSVTWPIDAFLPTNMFISTGFSPSLHAMLYG